MICTLKREVSETSASMFQILATKNKTWQKHRARVRRQPSHLQCDTWTIRLVLPDRARRHLCKCAYRGSGGGCQGTEVGREGLWRQSRPGAAFQSAFCHSWGFLTLPCFLVLANTFGGGVLERRCFHQPLMQALQSSPIQDPHSHSCLSCMYLPLSAPWDHLPKMRDHPPQTSDREHLICVL